MKKTIAALLLTLTAAALPLAPAAAQERPSWALSYLDAEGQPTDARLGYSFVAFVRGPRNYVLELACNNNNRMVFRIARRLAGEEQFSGASFLPTFQVKDNGRIVQDITLKNNFQYREAPMHYQGPVWPRLKEQLAKGDAVVVREERSKFAVQFSLRGSAEVIAALPCS